jgi:hypothetical protein
MSEENLEIVRQLQAPAELDLVAALADEEFVRAYLASATPLLDPDMESVFPPGTVGPAAGPQQGVEGFIAGYREWLSAWRSWYVETEEYVPLPADRVLVLVNDRGVSKTGGVELSFKGGAIFALRDQKVRRVEMFLERQQALQAAGLSE